MRRSRQTAACCISSLNPSWSEIANASEANAARALSLSPSVMRRSKLPSRQRGVLICVNVRSAAATDRELRRVGTGWKKVDASHRDSLTDLFITRSSVNRTLNRSRDISAAITRVRSLYGRAGRRARGRPAGPEQRHGSSRGRIWRKIPFKRGDPWLSGAIRRGRKARTGRPLRPFMKFLFTAFHELNSPLFLPCSRPKQIRGLAGRRLRSGGSFKGRIWQSRQ
jgi:hypothetical protein